MKPVGWDGTGREVLAYFKYWQINQDYVFIYATPPHVLNAPVTQSFLGKGKKPDRKDLIFKRFPPITFT